MSLSATPSTLDNNEDAIITLVNAPAAYNDYISVSCGATNNLDDYLDRATTFNWPEPSPEPITNVSRKYLDVFFSFQCLPCFFFFFFFALT